MRTLLVAVAALPFVAGCAADPAQVREDAGPYPEEYRDLALDYLRGRLFDPYSVRDAAIATPQARPSWVMTDPGPGWAVCWRGNARNRMGGYTGIGESVLLIRDGRVVASTAGPAPYYCGDAVFEPWPELEELS